MANYKDELKDTLVNRSMRTAGPTSPMGLNGGRGPEYASPEKQAPPAAPLTSVAPTGLPAPTPNMSEGIPPAWQRYSTGLKMQNAYANNWQPNPIILRMMRGR